MEPAIYFKKWHSPVGDLFLYSDDTHLVALAYEANHDAIVKRLALKNPTKKTSAVIDAALEQLTEYFAGQRKNFDIPVRSVGTQFQQVAWQELQRIPYGRTITYAEQAKRLKNASAVRAVGAANGKNPISIIVPCHRVIGADGSVTGYAGGIDAKTKLLSLEGIQLT